MSLSKPFYSLLGEYFNQLYTNPLRTKAITSSAFAISANYVAQKICGAEKIDIDNLIAYGLYGFILGGTIPHYFYLIIYKTLKKDIKFRRFILFLIERFIYSPVEQLSCLYFLSRLEGNGNQEAIHNLKRMFWSLIQNNWKYLSLPLLLNAYFTPPMVRPIISNLIGFIWLVYLAMERKKCQVDSVSDNSKI